MDFSRELPSAESILKALGIQTHSGSAAVLSEIALFGAGMLVGAGIALLLTPVTGNEVREEIGQRAHELRDKLRHNGDAETAAAEHGSSAEH